MSIINGKPHKIFVSEASLVIHELFNPTLKFKITHIFTHKTIKKFCTCVVSSLMSLCWGKSKFIVFVLNKREQRGTVKSIPDPFISSRCVWCTAVMIHGAQMLCIIISLHPGRYFVKRPKTRLRLFELFRRVHSSYSSIFKFFVDRLSLVMYIHIYICRNIK